MALKFFSLPKSKKYKITTRFYDPQKEAMKEREERFRKEMDHNNGEEATSSYGAGIKGSFRHSGKRVNSKTIAEARRKSNMRLLYIIIILSVLIYLFLK